MNSGPQMITHPSWPTPGEHLWTEWRAKTTTELYRYCIHPQCKVVESKPVPKAPVQ